MLKTEEKSKQDIEVKVMLKNPKLVIIFCAKNSETTIANSISKVRQSNYDPDVIVVDGFSTDNTIKIAEKLERTTVIKQPLKKYPGKGIAMRAGLEEALFGKYSNKSKSNVNYSATTIENHNRYDLALFLDSDIKNLSTDWVDLLVAPVIKEGYDMTRGYYDRHPRDGAVTKLIARPMLEVFFPEAPQFQQPLSGEVCAAMKVWSTLIEHNNSGQTPDGWGIDVWLLIETLMNGFKIKEVFMGYKDHTSLDAYRDEVGNLRRMAEQVSFTVLNEAVKYNRFDNYRNVGL
ncbi:glycosyltransferase [Candidatus Nitrosocosmicus sp. T]